MGKCALNGYWRGVLVEPSIYMDSSTPMPDGLSNEFFWQLSGRTGFVVQPSNSFFCQPLLIELISPCKLISLPNRVYQGFRCSL